MKSKNIRIYSPFRLFSKEKKKNINDSKRTRKDKQFAKKRRIGWNIRKLNKVIEEISLHTIIMSQHNQFKEKIHIKTGWKIMYISSNYVKYQSLYQNKIPGWVIFIFDYIITHYDGHFA